MSLVGQFGLALGAEMSRSGYSSDISNWDLIKWRGQVTSAIRGKRGQKLLRDLADAMYAMPEKKLIAHELKCDEGVCALGAVGQKRGIEMKDLDPEDSERVSKELDIAEQMAQEIVYINDEECEHKTPEERWVYVRKWVDENLKTLNG